MTVPQIPVWLDCDPGNDDAFAILLAAFHPQFKLVGISTVHGNAPLSMTTHNALGLLEVLGLEQNEVKVYAGAEVPLVKKPHYALDVHGKSGIGGAQLPENPRIAVSDNKDYLTAMKDAIEAYNGQLCIVATGTLTNLAHLFQKWPQLKQSVKLISIMGGAFDLGNATKYAEFNFYADPHAAQFIVEDPQLSYKTVLAPLNYTHKSIANLVTRSKLYNPENSELNSNLRLTFHKILMFYYSSYIKNPAFIDGPPVHDPLALFLVIKMLALVNGERPSKFEYHRVDIKVVVDGEHEGESVACGNSELGVVVGDSTDFGEFWSYVETALRNADHHIQGHAE